MEISNQSKYSVAIVAAGPAQWFTGGLVGCGFDSLLGHNKDCRKWHLLLPSLPRVGLKGP